VDTRGIVRTALELSLRRHYSEVVALCADALPGLPDHVELRLLHAKALLALRHDLEAQRELSACLRLRPRCPLAYRLLGELALRRDELESAKIFLREALRLDDGDRQAADLLDIVLALRKPTAAVEKLPAATAAVGSPVAARPRRGGMLAIGTESGIDRERRLAAQPASVAEGAAAPRW
jgi:uncharacterized protein HemY